MEAIGRLAGGMAHDFNNVLTVIKGYSELLLMEQPKRDLPIAEIAEIHKAVGRASNLTRQLLAVSRRQVMEMRTLDLNRLITALLKMLQPVIGEEIELVTSLAGNLGRVKADPGQIERTILNLAVNARDSMPSGGRLLIETANARLDEAYARHHTEVTPGPHVMLSVSDTGVGMTSEIKERIFEPFFTTKEKGKGTGLGLSVVYGIVKQSGGHIWVYSEPDIGTTFKIYLPRVDEEAEKMSSGGDRESIPQGRETILVAEDDENVRHFMVGTLQKLGYNVLEAPHGKEALQIQERHGGPIHLVLTDVAMPGMSGPELVQHLRSSHPGINVLYISGYSEHSTLRPWRIDKGENYLQKLFALDRLAQTIRELLDGSLAQGGLSILPNK
jgi:two-component system cell cycle sensor histidine kinase/response regulator CckA